MSALSSDIRFLKGVGEKRARLLYKLGIADVGALLRFYPRAYEDFSRVTPVICAPYGESCCVRAAPVSPVKEHYIRKGMVLYKCLMSDGQDTFQLTLFNNKYTAEKLTQGKGVLLFGKVGGNFAMREMSSPSIEFDGGAVHLRPIYRQTENLTSRQISRIVQTALNGVEDSLADPLPETLRERQGLCGLVEALRGIHFPKDAQELERARVRLIFEELFVLQLGLKSIKSRVRTKSARAVETDCSQEFFEALPFSPTNAQRRAVAEAIADMRSGYPLNRLLQGDVGSGKTAVAAALIHTAAKNGMQAAFMAPTELLAAQHFASLQPLLAGCGVRCALLTGSVKLKDKRRIKDLLITGRIDLVIGTHALISQDVEFAGLGLVITDEQHRFGVEQRAKLTSKGENPHTLVMSATPIPRTLGMTIYGDLDVSVLDELPPGRRHIGTYFVDTSYRPRIYNFIKKHLDKGLQAYIVCPLIEEGETDAVNVVEYYEQLVSDPFKDYSVGLLHGRLKPAESARVMGEFAAGGIQLLVATTVIEVGVDVPGAVVMLIENAERFGLSQLHQLRGRVGRSDKKSYCVLVSDAQNESTAQRLRVMCDTNDGFKIAETDLALRGPGDFFGSRQHGLPELRIADMLTDLPLLREAGAYAGELIKTDPRLEKLENALLREEVERLFSSNM